MMPSLVRDCLCCGFTNPLCAVRCEGCNAPCGPPPDEAPLDIEDQLPEDYLPVYRSPNLLTLREALEALEGDYISPAEYQDVVVEVGEAVSPGLSQLEGIELPHGLPEEAAVTFRETVRHYRAFFEAIVLMLDQPQVGYNKAQEALINLDRLERQATREIVRYN